MFLLLLGRPAAAQQVYKGIVLNAETREPVKQATIQVKDTSLTLLTDNQGHFSFRSDKEVSLHVTAAGYEPYTGPGTGHAGTWVILLAPRQEEMENIVVSGTLRALRKTDSPVAVEVYTPQFLKKNPAPSIFESLQHVNGVRPQLNCSVCNTGDIHINGLEGPYTMVTIDGMPIVSSLASVYGLFGIPTQLIERVEIVKGPASGLYGAEAIGGLINIITKSPDKAPLLSGQVMTTSWQEHSLDLGLRFRLAPKISSLLGISYFNFQHPYDKNNDQFTDVALQHRVSVFNKLSMARKNGRIATLAARYFYEDRWGGDTRWNRTFRGTDSIYGESIYTGRWELIGNYQLPVPEKIFLSFSGTAHRQRSWYGNIPYMGDQRIGFAQLIWDKKAGDMHHLLLGSALRYNYYDDNSTATRDTLTGRNQPEKYFLPGIFLQDEWRISSRHLLLSGLRYDHHPIHRSVITPRIAWKWSINDRQTLRLNAGTGFRVVSLFTEDHAALTGARAVEIKETLRPEKSYNVNLNYSQYFKWTGMSFNIDASAWYSHFTNQIIADYDTDPNKIVYQNLRGYAGSKGLTLNLEWNVGRRLKSLLGATLQDIRKVERDEDGSKQRITPVLTEKWSGTWSISWSFPGTGLTLDYTGNIYGPMRLPLLSPTDPRPAYSPVWSIQNIQVTKLLGTRIELFGGVKNLLNWTPARHAPFLIARAHDPFDKKVEYEPDGSIKATAENPYALSFDPSYVYAPNQGIRLFAGLRYTVSK